MNDAENRRATPRRRTIFGGVIFDDNGLNWECSVSDISSTGVKVRSSQVPGSDTEINLKINKYNDLRRCQVTWTREGEFGLRFLVPISEHDDDIYRLLKLMGSDRR
jgi:hypothetical protein